MRRPRLAPLYGVPFTALLALLQSVQWWQSVRAGSPSTSVLWLTALLWGTTIGSLLHAFWPWPLPGDERGRWAWGGGGTVRALYAVPTLLLCLYPLALTLRPPAASVQKALQNLADEVGELHAGSCNALPGWPGNEQAGAARCLSSFSDGPVLVQKLQAAVNRSAAQAVGPAWKAEPGARARGQKLFTAGDPARNVIACAVCHGDNERGLNANHIASVTNLPPQYALEVLKESHEAPSFGGLVPPENMRIAVKPLTDKDLKDVATYISSMKSTGSLSRFPLQHARGFSLPVD